MSDPRLISYLEGMKKRFWHERRHLQQDEIKLQWAARAAPYTSVLLDTEAPTQTLELTSTSGQQMARQSTSKSWARMTAARRRASDTVTPLELGQRCHDDPSSEPMSRKRARTSQYGSESTAQNAIVAPSLDINPWQRDSNAPYCGYTHTSTSGPSFKARRTSAGRMPIKIPQHSPNIRVYEPTEYVQQSGAIRSSTYSPPTQQSGLNDQCILPSSFELPSPLSVSPTTTMSERFADTTPPTSAAMSRQDSLAASFCEAFGMMRANSGLSEIDSGRDMHRQDSCRGPKSNPFSPDGQGLGTAFDPSLYFAHAEGTAIENSLTSMPAVEQLRLPTAFDLDVEMKRDLSSSSIPAVENLQPLSNLELHTKMTRDASADSNISSTSRISRRSQEQIAQAARPIAPKDATETQSPIPSSSSFLSGSQDMLRQRSAPEPKVSIPKLQYSRQTKEKLKCERCNKNPDGYRGAHELHRHMALDHDFIRTAWVCVDISSDGFLSGCAACESKKPYGQDYNAAAHLRRFHFHPKSETRRTNVDPEERRGGKGGGKDPPMSECRRWMEKIKVRGKDYMTLADSAVDDAAAEDDEEFKGEQGDQDEIVEDHFLLGNVEKNSRSLQPHDGAVGQQISASALEGANGLELAMINDRQFALPSIDAPFSRSGFPPAFETPFDAYFDSDAPNFATSNMNLACSHPTFPPSAPAAPSFLISNSADPALASDNFARNTADPIDIPSTMSTTTTAHTLEDLTNFQSSYIPGNLSCGMSSPNNPQFAYGLPEFSPFR